MPVAIVNAAVATEGSFLVLVQEDFSQLKNRDERCDRAIQDRIGERHWASGDFIGVQWQNPGVVFHRAHAAPALRESGCSRQGWTQ